MQYRRLGKTDWPVSAISMGCWGIGGQWGPVADEEAIATIHAALDHGITLFDTADSYGLGRSEELVGTALRDRHDGVYVATKVGNFARRIGAPLSYDTPHHIYLCCDASLGRLKRDTIDLYQCHLGEHMDAQMAELRRAREQNNRLADAIGELLDYIEHGGSDALRDEVVARARATCGR